MTPGHRRLLIGLLLLLRPGLGRAEGSPHLLFSRGPAPPLLELILEEELPGARVEAGAPHALRAVVRPSPENGGWLLELRRPGGRLLLSRTLDAARGEEAAARVIVFLISRTLARLGPRDEVAPEALAALDPPPLPGQGTLPAVVGPGRRRTLSLLVSLPWWQRPARTRPGFALDLGVAGDRLGLSLRMAATPPSRIASSEIEARVSDLLIAALLEASLLRGVRGELGLGAAAGVDFGWIRARARFPLAPGSPGREARFFSPLPWSQLTVNLAIDPGDPRLELLGRAGFALRPLARQVLLPRGYTDEGSPLEEGVIMPVLELGLRAVF